MLKTHARRTPKPTSGFTLVELLVAVGLTAILMWGLLNLYTFATRFSRTMFNEAELSAIGRAALDRLCRELASAATPDVGYLQITNSGVSDEIRFVAPIGDGATLAHLRYYLDTDADPPGLYRAVKTPVENNEIPTDYTRETPIGVNVIGFNVRYVEQGSATDTEPAEGNSTTWKDDDVTDGVQRLPRAVLVEITVADTRSGAAVTLSSAAILGASGM